LHNGERWSGEFLVRRRDGTTFLAEVIDSPIHDDAGQLIGIIGLSNDITARKRAERRRTVQYAVSQVLADSATLADAVPCILQAIGESLELKPRKRCGREMYSSPLLHTNSRRH
jgi:hypothetical protein